MLEAVTWNVNTNNNLLFHKLRYQKFRKSELQARIVHQTLTVCYWVLISPQLGNLYKNKVTSDIFIKLTHSYIQITLLHELEDLLLTDSVLLAEQAITWPSLCSFLRQCGSLDEVAPRSTCLSLCSWVPADKKSSCNSGCTLRPCFLRGIQSCPQSERSKLMAFSGYSVVQQVLNLHLSAF